jgi:hypothetical protein
MNRFLSNLNGRFAAGEDGEVGYFSRICVNWWCGFTGDFCAMRRDPHGSRVEPPFKLLVLVLPLAVSQRYFGGGAAIPQAVIQSRIIPT